jgi:putative serine protease PepD
MLPPYSPPGNQARNETTTHIPAQMNVPQTPPQPFPGPWATGQIPMPQPMRVSAPPSGRSSRRTRIFWVSLLATLLLLATLGAGINIGLWFAGPRATPTPPATDLQQQVIAVIQRVQPSVVAITSQGSQGEGVGAGEIVTSDGYIVTNDHVVRGFARFAVTLSTGQTITAQVVAEVPQEDLALLKIARTQLPAIRFGDSNQAQVGQFVIALGSPLGLDQSATFGIISALNRTVSERPNGPAERLTGVIQMSAPIYPGNSGGALIDLQGHLLGIPTLGATSPADRSAATGIGFAIASQRVMFIIQPLLSEETLLTA